MAAIRTQVYLDDEKWVEIPLPVPVDDIVVHHYTSASGLIGILASNSLWASSPVALNDLSEVEYGIEVLHRVWESIQSEKKLSSEQITIVNSTLSPEHLRLSIGRVYFVCASEASDSLNQWQSYGAPPGYALGIQTGHDLSVMVPSALASFTEWTSTGTHMRSGWYRVIYAQAEQDAAARAVLNFVLDHPLLWQRPDLLGNYVAPIIPQMKNPAFSAEHEVRYIAQSLVEIPEEFRAGPFGVVPYISIAAGEDHHSFVVEDTRGRLPIVSLTCGPVGDGEKVLVNLAAVRLLAKHGYTDAVVKSSEVPYRVR